MKKTKRERLSVGDLVQIHEIWNDTEMDWDEVELVGLVIGINESEIIDGRKTSKKSREETFVTILVGGIILEEDYAESDISLLKRCDA